jgi:hypothetical protein
LLSNLKAKVELGYCDIVEPRQWLRETVDYWLAHPPPIDGRGNHLKREDFDYVSEDQLLSWWDTIRNGAPIFGLPILHRHVYPHPYRPGDELEG